MLLSLPVLFLVFQVESELQVHIRNFVFRVLLGNVESLIELFQVSQIFDQSIRQVHSLEHLDELLLSQVLVPLFGNLHRFSVCGVRFANPDAVFPHFLALIHLHGVVPVSALDVVILGLVELSTILQLLRDL